MMNTNEKPLILAVDDTPANLTVLTGFLREHYKVKAATSGPKALEIAFEYPPDIVLLDIMMPGMDGYEVCRRLKANPATAHVPVIFLTARTEVADEEQGFAEGAVDFIHKPMSPPIVLARVKTHLTLKAQADQLRKMAFVDGLTGVANRRYFNDIFDRSWRQCFREQQSLALFLIDIDHFKQYNDHYGHQEGDVCLQNVAQTLAMSLKRPQDVVARYGGEEFVCLLPATGFEEALRKAGEIVEAVHEKAIPHAHSSAADVVTISLGLAVCVPCESQTPEDFIKQADACLYAAKHQGRNRHCSSHSPA
jgi:diguanylate cyclase (GGDEF)-like protein